MKKLLLLLFLLPALTYAQVDTSAGSAGGSVFPKDTSYWKTGITFNLNGSQASFVNWAGGGQNSIAFSLVNSAFAEYTKDKVNWSTSLDLGFGMSRLGSYKDASINFRKTDDKLVFLSKFSYGLKKVKYSALVDFRSQLANGFSYVGATDSGKVFNSRFLAPAYLILGTGIEYNPNEDFYVFYSPVTVKGTIVNYQPFADAGQFGVREGTFDSLGTRITKGRNYRFEYGSYLNAKYQKDLAKNIALTTTLSLFEAYFREYKDENGNYKIEPNGNIDVFWDVTLLMKVSKYITASIATSLVYDDDIKVFRTKYANDPTNPNAYGPDLQFREVIAVGLSASIRNKNAKLAAEKKN